MLNIEHDFKMIRERLEFHEGLRLLPYYCTAGKLTIGVGHNCEARDFTEEEKKAIGDWKHGITKNAAYMILKNDVQICLEQLKKIEFFSSLDKERQYALLDMCFQMGYRRLACFHKTLKWMKQGLFKFAAEECLKSAYAKQTPVRAKRIARLIATGVWK